MTARPAERRTAPGVTRFDLVCSPEFVGIARELTERWAEDRALVGAARERLGSLTSAALTHGLLFEPRGVSIFVRWLDPDRVRLDVKWVGCSKTARARTSCRDVEATISTLDAYAEEWGVAPVGSGWVHWMVARAG